MSPVIEDCRKPRRPTREVCHLRGATNTIEGQFHRGDSPALVISNRAIPCLQLLSNLLYDSVDA
jgi:hypothetical protein